MRTGVIYKIECTSNNKFIIGSSLSFKSRRNAHLWQLENNKHNNKALQNCYNKYGYDNIKFQILQENIPSLILRDVENIWIGVLCAKDNDKKGGMNLIDADQKNISESTKLKMSKAQKGKKLSDKTKLKISKGLFGRKDSEKQINRKKNFKHSKKTIQKIIDAHSIPVYQYSLQGEFIREWTSSTEAAKTLNFNQGLISACCNNKRKKHKNFIWSFYKNTNPYVNKEKYNQIVIKVMDLNYNILGTFNSATKAAEFMDVSSASITNALKGKKIILRKFRIEKI